MQTDLAEYRAKKTPGFAVVLDVVGWLCLIGAVALAILTAGDGPYWPGIVGSLMTGILFLGLGDVIRRLHRIETK